VNRSWIWYWSRWCLEWFLRAIFAIEKTICLISWSAGCEDDSPTIFYQRCIEMQKEVEVNKNTYI